jgi:hypothetical protein
MSVSARLACLLVLMLVLAMAPGTALANDWITGGSTGVGLQQTPDVVTMRLGISPGDEHQDLVPGTDRRALERSLPELFETAMALGVRIDTVSVGKGFFAGDRGVEVETDLDLVVTGIRPNVLALGAILGQRWGQSVVFAWENRPDGDMLTATGLLPGGADKLNDAGFDLLHLTLPDGGHVRYAGADSALFVANTGNVSESEFRRRLGEAQVALESSGVRTGSLTVAKATMVTLDRDNYQQYINAAERGKSALLPSRTATLS